jgi:hypothetical protein
LQSLINQLLQSGQPSIRWKVRVNVLGEDITSADMLALQNAIRESDITKRLLAGLTYPQYNKGKGIYAKWQGAHWIMASLADIGYPEGDEQLVPVKNALLDFWLQKDFYTEFEAYSQAKAYQKPGVPVMQGRHRRCAAQQGNALWMLLKLGLHDERLNNLAERLQHWQWPDGGWNCDKNPDASHSSFMETLLPLRGLSLYAQTTGNAAVTEAVIKAAEVFLKRHLYKRQGAGEIIHPEFTALHYPLYWHYDILAGLKVIAEAGLINDLRCKDALDLLESKQLPGGGWPAEKAYYKTSNEIALNADYINWGGTSKSRINEWVTADALFVLNKACRI